MTNQFTIPKPVNEPIKDYAPGSPEKETLLSKLEEMSSHTIDIPLIIGGEEIRTGDTVVARADRWNVVVCESAARQISAGRDIGSSQIQSDLAGPAL